MSAKETCGEVICKEVRTSQWTEKAVKERRDLKKKFPTNGQLRKT